MKKLFKFFFQVPVSVIILLICCSPKKNIDIVKISIKTPSIKGVNIKISIYNMLNQEESLIAEAKSDSMGTCDFEFALSKPTLASLEVGDKRSTIYLEPGYNLNAFVEGYEDKPMSYTGIGLEANNYLAQVSSAQKKFERVGGINIYELDQEKFLNRIDSLQSSLTDFHQHFTDSVPMANYLSELLVKRNALNVISIRQIYGWNYGTKHNFEIPETLNVLDKIPFDSALLSSGMNEYAMVLHMYMQLRFYIPPFINKTQEENKNLRVSIPTIINNEIQQSNYPLFVKEFLQAKNIDHWMSTFGLVPSVGTLYTNFKKQYPLSFHISSLEAQFNEWVALSPGNRAPVFSGTTSEGKNLTLTDLRGKVVYVDVWATWCAPCIEEIPYAKKLQKEFEANDNVEFLYVSIDRDKEAWKKFILKDKSWKGLHINQLQEQTNLFWKAYKMSGVPTYILIDQAGNIVDAKATRPSDGKVKGQIKGLLNKKI